MCNFLKGLYGKLSEEKICFCLDFFPNGLDPPPPVFLKHFEELCLNLVLYDLKFIKVLDCAHPPQFSMENV